MSVNDGFSERTKNAIVIPIYNEARVIKGVIERLQEVRPDDFIIAIDDASVDTTYEVLRGLPRIFLCRHSVNLGQGGALQTGFDAVKTLLCNVGTVTTFDGDGQHDPVDIETALGVLSAGKYDVLLGSRFLGNSVGMPIIKKIILKMLVLIGRLFGSKLTDTHNGFRIFDIKALNNINLSDNGMGHASEIIEQIFEYRMKIVEFPITVHYTEYSIAKGQSIWNGINILFQNILRRMR